jgi:hypothetical protein
MFYALYDRAIVDKTKTIAEYGGPVFSAKPSEDSGRISAARARKGEVGRAAARLTQYHRRQGWCSGSPHVVAGDHEKGDEGVPLRREVNVPPCAELRQGADTRYRGRDGAVGAVVDVAGEPDVAARGLP